MSYTSNRLPIRLIAGAWSLAALVFVLSYNSTLITYVLAPTNHRMVGSFHELVESSRFTTEKSDITLWLRKSGTIDNLLRKVIFKYCHSPVELFNLYHFTFCFEDGKS